MNRTHYIIECNSNTSGNPELDEWYEWYVHPNTKWLTLESAKVALRAIEADHNSDKSRSSNGFRLVRMTRDVVYE